MSMNRTCAISSRKSDLVSADIRGGLGAKNLRGLSRNQKISNPATVNATTPTLIIMLSCLAKDFLNQRFEARLTAQRVEHRFDLEECDIVSVPLLVRFFEQLYRFVLLAES